jgi:hypothetical protein
MTQITDIVHEDQYTFLIIFRSVLLIIKMFQRQFVEKLETHILYSITFFFKSCPLLGKVEKQGRAWKTIDDKRIRRMRILCWVTRATDTRSEYEIHVAFPLQNWLRERACMLHLYKYCLSGLNLS